MAQPTSPAALALWAQESPLLPADVPDEAAAAALRALGLPLSLEAAGEPPLLPFPAPFSGVVPFLLRLFRGSVFALNFFGFPPEELSFEVDGTVAQ